MAIHTEQLTINGVQFIHTYSDDGMLIHGGMPEGDYDDVYDPVSTGRTYTETNIPIPPIEETVEELQAKVAEWRNKYNIAEARTERLDRIKAQIEALRDAAVLPSTKAIYQAILDLFEEGES
jgi:hypothetical protein